MLAKHDSIIHVENNVQLIAAMLNSADNHQTKYEIYQIQKIWNMKYIIYEIYHIWNISKIKYEEKLN